MRQLKSVLLALLILSAARALFRHQSPAARFDTMSLAPESQSRSEPQAHSLSTSEIQNEKLRASDALESEALIVKANSGTLSESERERLGQLLDRYHAAVIAEWESLDGRLD